MLTAANWLTARAPRARDVDLSVNQTDSLDLSFFRVGEQAVTMSAPPGSHDRRAQKELMMSCLQKSELLPHHRRPGSGNPAALDGPRPVLLAVTDADYPRAALLRSFKLARSLQTTLHVARVLPRSGFASFARNLGPVRATDQVERCLRAARETLAWCNDVLPEPLPMTRVRIFIGELVSEIADHASALKAALITLAPSTGHLGTTAAALARGSMRPVLVLREGDWHGPLLAATTLESELEPPVLKHAVHFGRQIDASIVALHNVSDGFMMVGPGPHTPERPSDASTTQRRRSRLTRTVERLGHQMSTVVTNEMDPADAILDQARAHEAQLIVLGTRQRSWVERSLEPSVAIDVVNRSELSVLLTPFLSPKS